VELLRDDPAFADEYLHAAMEQADEEGGREALLSALRHVAEAQGMA
jgi:DNA-binding phage protein